MLNVIIKHLLKQSYKDVFTLKVVVFVLLTVHGKEAVTVHGKEADF